ncbi:hypothetical protein O6H91_03G008100 [Diphasiastrum complanatum]|nr:hypothetical protein O6H91_03G008100 [Diphasiastrum complanatum]KAJ7560972.1 hypothetical protein O6H91_03G008100 [Diphasiastrum complanatum]
MKVSCLPGSTEDIDNIVYAQCPPHGVMSVLGRRRTMEDAVVAVPAFLSLPCYALENRKESTSSKASAGRCSFHFFGVYDGHGGSQAATFCKDRLHLALVEESKRVTKCAYCGGGISTDCEMQWQKVMAACFNKVDAEVGGGFCKGRECPVCAGSGACEEHHVVPDTVGSTAVVAVVGLCQIIVANCGDSRAVLSRGGKAIPLSSDHKPDREDELARVEAAGGRVIFWDSYRLLGVLAMSRAIGDRYLKPYVIADPEVTYTPRVQEDEFLILASDGLWSVLSNEAACDIVRKCMTGRCKVSLVCRSSCSTNLNSDDSLASAAASLLTKLAFARGSNDNISVVVVDLTEKKR